MAVRARYLSLEYGKTVAAGAGATMLFSRQGCSMLGSKMVKNMSSCRPEQYLAEMLNEIRATWTLLIYRSSHKLAMQRLSSGATAQARHCGRKVKAMFAEWTRRRGRVMLTRILNRGLLRGLLHRFLT
jgi:hypothetical protein